MRPPEGAVLEVSPPGFCWWRADERGTVRYRLMIRKSDDSIVYVSPLLHDPVHVPTKAFPAGQYQWTVDAIDQRGQIRDTLSPRTFEIAADAFEQPWIDADTLLARVPQDHPRLLFPTAQLEEIRKTLATSRREAFESLQQAAEPALGLGLVPEPTYDQIADRAERRLAYFRAFRETRRYHLNGMVPLALMYVLTGEDRYGVPAKRLLLSAADWDPEGISSILAPYGDEVGLGLAKAGPHCYDWLYGLLTDAERAKVRRMLVARGDQLLQRLEKRDFLARPQGSHNGRLPGYLIEHAIALADHPRASAWMDYALRALMTVFPHWGGDDGGWAEGVPYGVAYNTIYLMPFESLRMATGHDLWPRPFYRNVRYFLLYHTSPQGEITPFGDGEHASVAERASAIRSLLMFHAGRYQDDTIRQWIELLKTSDGQPARVRALPGLLWPDTIPPGTLNELPPDAAFFSVGWAALHSNLADPSNDLMVVFKSSPYGAVSHSHADQNSFAIMKGGRALAIPGGQRYPIHGSPFHTQYTQQTVAHNSILVDGKGQVVRNGNAGGQLTEFQTTAHLGYVCGDAKRCYDGLLTRCRRHVLLVRPSLVCVVDDLEATRASSFQWLFHARERLQLSEPTQTFISRRSGAVMDVQLITPGGFRFEQTDEWPIDPREGFPTATATPPPSQWHFTAHTRQATPRRRIAAVMLIGTEEDDTRPTCKIHRGPGDVLEVGASFAENTATIRIQLSDNQLEASPILEVNYKPHRGESEQLLVQ